MTLDGSDTPPVADTPQPPKGSWWNTLRVRFGVLLALALLPWLLLTTLEAFRSLNQTRLSQMRSDDLLATNTVSEVSLTLQAGRFGLDAAPGLIAEEGCEAASRHLLARLRVYKAFIVQDESGQVVCEAPFSLESLATVGATEFQNGENFRIERGRLDDGEGDGVQPVVLLQNRMPRTGRVYTLVLPKTLGLREVLNVTMGADAAVALTKPGGEPILGVRLPVEDSQRLRDRITPGLISLIDIDVPVEGSLRRIATTYHDDLGVYVTVGRDRDSGFGELLNPFSAMLLPILAWIVGFSLIWLGTQTMLIAPLNRVRSAARSYAAGRLEERVTLSGSAAGEVRGLALTFNRMAGQLEDRNARIADNLDEKDILLREIHHRVKNNLQIIISLLNMQERKVDTPEALEAIAESRARINAIAVVHRGLHESEDLRSIQVPTFVSRLLGSMNDSLSLRGRGIRLHQDVEACTLTADTAIPLALFIVEAIGNAAQHGLPEGGDIHVRIATSGEDRLSVTVSDNGIGVADPSSIKGIGTRLMKGFARQLGAELHFRDNTPGLAAQLVMPLDAQPEAPFQVSRRHSDTQ